jgi:hypothetical protein
MTKDKPKVSFYGKELNLLEARLYQLGLKWGLVDITLTEEDERDYLRWSDLRKNRNELSIKLASEKLFKDISEKKYLIENLEQMIDSTKTERKKFYCENHGGHKAKKGSEYTPTGCGGVIYVSCARCGMAYEKGAKYKPENLDKKIMNPFKG